MPKSNHKMTPKQVVKLDIDLGVVIVLLERKVPGGIINKNNGKEIHNK